MSDRKPKLSFWKLKGKPKMVDSKIHEKRGLTQKQDTKAEVEKKLPMQQEPPTSRTDRPYDLTAGADLMLIAATERPQVLDRDVQGPGAATKS